MKRRIGSLTHLALLAALCLLTLSCWNPYYSNQVSDGASFAAKLGSPYLTIGPVADSQGFGDAQASYQFLPSRPTSNPLAPSNGFIVRQEGQNLVLGFVESYNGSYRLAPSYQYMYCSLGSNALIRPAAADSSGNPRLCILPDSGDLWQFAFKESAHSLDAGVDVTATSGVSVYGLGARLLMPASGDTDTYAALCQSGSTFFVSEASLSSGSIVGAFSTAASSLDTGTASLSAGGSAFLDTKNGRFYYSNPTGPCYVWDTSSWTTTGPGSLAIGSRLTASLSDGTLVAQSGSSLQTYSTSGQQLLSVQTGGIRLQQEEYSANGNYLIFTQVLPVYANGAWQFSIYVWRCPLSALSSL